MTFYKVLKNDKLFGIDQSHIAILRIALIYGLSIGVAVITRLFVLQRRKDT